MYGDDRYEYGSNAGADRNDGDSDHYDSDDDGDGDDITHLTLTAPLFCVGLLVKLLGLV